MENLLTGYGGLGHRSAHQIWSAATCRRFPNYQAISTFSQQKLTPLVLLSGPPSIGQ